jgi:hypothetical protein
LQFCSSLKVQKNIQIEAAAWLPRPFYTKKNKNKLLVYAAQNKVRAENIPDLVFNTKTLPIAPWYVLLPLPLWGP